VDRADDVGIGCSCNCCGSWSNELHDCIVGVEINQHKFPHPRCERSACYQNWQDPIGFTTINEGLEHVERLDRWIKAVEEAGYEISCDGWLKSVAV
jgi:hypothetical protein